MITRLVHALVIAVSVACALPSAVAAQGAPSQEDDPARAAAARALFQEGVDLARRESYAEAADRFRRAYALRPAPSIAFNLASALTHQGRLVEAHEVLTRALRASDIDPAMRQSMQTQRDTIAPRLGRLLVRLDGDARDVSVQLDGRDVPEEAIGIALPADPGAHEAIAIRGGEEIARARTELGDGASGEIVLAVPPPVVAAAAIDPRAEEQREEPPPPAGGGDDGVWIAIGVAAGVLVVGGAVVAGVLLAPGAAPEPVSGNAMPGVITW